MNQKMYKIKLSEFFKYDLEQIITYISYKLKSPKTAENLNNEIERAIRKRAENPEIYAKYYSQKNRRNTYYKIYVKKYVIFYTVIDDVMEVRRILNRRQDIVFNDILE